MYTIENTNKISFGRMIKYHREQVLNINQEDFAKRINDFLHKDSSESFNSDKIHRTQVSKWEKGKAFPTMLHCIAICEVLKVDLNFLLGATNNPLPDNIDLSIKTGLSPETISRLIAVHDTMPELSKSINLLLSGLDGESILRSLYRMLKENSASSYKEGEQ